MLYKLQHLAQAAFCDSAINVCMYQMMQCASQHQRRPAYLFVPGSEDHSFAMRTPLVAFGGQQAADLRVEAAGQHTAHQPTICSIQGSSCQALHQPLRLHPTQSSLPHNSNNNSNNSNKNHDRKCMPARARCVWSQSELARQTCSERLDTGPTQELGLYSQCALASEKSNASHPCRTFG